jgi:hypothetical protein
MDGIISVCFCENNMAVERELNRNRYVILFQEVSTSTTKKEEDETKGLDYYHICC